MSGKGVAVQTNCFVERYDFSSSNADMDGIAVSAANVLVVVCLRILTIWSPGDIGEGIRVSLLQIYPILLSALLSINRQTLSLYDASFALLLTSSPLTVYVVVASICDLFGFETDLYKRVRSHRCTTRILGALVPFPWLCLSMTIRFSDGAFVNSEFCHGSSFKDWLSDLFRSFLSPLTSVKGLLLVGLSFIPVFVLVFGLCLFRRRSQAMEDFQADREGEPKLWRRLRMPWTFVKCAWRAVDRNHKWCTFSLLVYFDYSWGFRILNSAWFATMLEHERKEYKNGLSYGQVLSVFSAFPPLISVVKLGYLRRWNLLRFYQRFPRLFRAEVAFLLTGYMPDPPIGYSHLPFNLASYPEKPTFGKPRDRTTTYVQLARQSSLLPGLGHAALRRGDRDENIICCACSLG